MVACSHVPEYTPANICTSNIQVVDLEDHIVPQLRRSDKENLVLLNCTLHLKCGVTMQNDHICDVPKNG